MRALRYEEQGGIDVLRLVDVPRPSPACDELLVEVHTASVNPIDAKFRNGHYTPPELPMTTGSDLAGVVVEHGDRVSDFSTGDRVLVDGLNKGSGYQGSFAEYALAPVGKAAMLPESVAFVEAAALGHAGLTAWVSIVEYGDVTIGDSCLVHGGSGGVGHIGVQLANRSGAKVVATAGTDGGVARLGELGVDVPLDYRRVDLQEVIGEVGRFDVILDPFPDQYLDLDIDVAANEATVVNIEGRDVSYSLSMMARRKNVGFYQIGAGSSPHLREILDTLLALVDRGLLQVHVNERFDLADGAEAQRYAIEENDFGKVVVEVR